MPFSAGCRARSATAACASTATSPPGPLAALSPELAPRLATDFPGHAYLAAHHLYRGDDARRLARLAEIADETGLPLVAVNDVLYHVPERRPLQDVVTCIREHCTITEAG